MQIGATCGLHAVNHILASCESNTSARPPRVLTQATFESIALAAQLGDSAHNLCQPGCSNYDLAALSINLTRVGLSLFPLTPADIEGFTGRSSLLPVNRLDEPFSPHVIQGGFLFVWVIFFVYQVMEAIGLLCYLLIYPTSPSTPTLLHCYVIHYMFLPMLLTACALDAAHMAINAYV